MRLLTLGAAQVRVVPYMFDPRPDETGHVSHRITISVQAVGQQRRLPAVLALDESPHSGLR